MTKVHALYGNPVDHSLSPTIFNRTFDKLGMDRVYVPFKITNYGLEQAVEASKSLGFEGFNVTMPHKEAVTKHLDRLDGEAEVVGAVNVVARRGDELVGFNTDGQGALKALKSYDLNPKNKRILVIGAGGASRAIVNSLSRQGGEIQILNRTAYKAAEVATLLSRQVKVSYDELSRTTLLKGINETDLIVNTTPLETERLLNRFDLSEESLRKGLWIFDLVYNGTQDARPGTSAKRVSGLELLLQQAALSYKVWLNEEAPLEIMRRALEEKLGRDWREGRN